MGSRGNRRCDRSAERAPGPRPPTSKLSTLMGDRGSRMSASSFLWRLTPAPSPDTASGAPGIFPVGGGRLMPPPPPGPHPAPRAPARPPRGLAPPSNRRLRPGLRPGPPPASSSGFGSQRPGTWGCRRGRPGPAENGEEQTASPPLSQIRAARSVPPPRAPSGLRGRERGSGAATAGPGLSRPLGLGEAEAQAPTITAAPSPLP